jgi:hypothetical protein
MRRRGEQLTGACFFITFSFTSVPRPGRSASTSSPFSITGTCVTSSSFHGTSSTSISMMRKFGTAAQKCALTMLARWPS